MSALELGVLLAPAVLDTSPFQAGRSTLDVFGQEVAHHRSADRDLVGGQELGLTLLGDTGTRNHELLLLEVGVALDLPRYDAGSLVLKPVLVDVRVDVGMLGWFDTRGEPPPVDGFVDFGAGARGSFLSLEPFTTAFAPSPHGFLGFGLANRRGVLRYRAEVRGEVAPRFDHLEGRAEQVEGAVAWTWWPGTAAVSLVLGVSGRPAARTLQPTASAERSEP